MAVRGVENQCAAIDRGEGGRMSVRLRSIGVAGAVLDVQVDGSDVAQVTTDGDGNAPFDIAGVADGEHVLTVVFDGDGGHRATQKDRDFSVGCDEDCGGE
jgi:hypothetical protein